MAEQRLIRISEVMRLTSMSRAHIYRMIARGEFPAQRRLSHRMAVWSEAEVSKWMETQFEH